MGGKTTDEKLIQNQLKNKEEELILGPKELGFSYSPTPIVDWERYLETERVSFKARLRQNVKQNNIKMKDFVFLMNIGTGAFGKVLLVLKRDTNSYYAAKLLNKKTIKEANCAGNILSEKQILSAIRFVFTIHLEYFFQDHTTMIFILPLAIGGDLFHYLKQEGKLTEKNAIFYIGQIVLALEYLHHMNLIYRDLKPENILIDHQGYLKLADFGFCKLVTEKTYTICGTPEYLAPEILKKTGYGNSVDWWSLGITIFELCSGYTPFYSKDRKLIYSKISEGKYYCPPYFSGHLQDLIWNLLQTDETIRFGSLRRGANDIKEHKWFKNISWLPLLNCQIRPPMVPNVAVTVDGRMLQQFGTNTVDETDYEKFFKHF